MRVRRDAGYDCTTWYFGHAVPTGPRGAYYCCASSGGMWCEPPPPADLNSNLGLTVTAGWRAGTEVPCTYWYSGHDDGLFSENWFDSQHGQNYASTSTCSGYLSAGTRYVPCALPGSSDDRWLRIVMPCGVGMYTCDADFCKTCGNLAGYCNKECGFCTSMEVRRRRPFYQFGCGICTGMTYTMQVLATTTQSS